MRAHWMHLVPLALALACSGGGNTDGSDGTDTEDGTDTTDTTDTTDGTDTEQPVDNDTPVVDVQLTASTDVPSMFVVSWRQNEIGDAWVEFKIDGEDEWRATPRVGRRQGDNEQLVIGVPYETGCQYRVMFDDGTQANPYGAGTHTTGNQPGPLPSPNIAISDADAYWDGGEYILGSINQDSGGWTDGKYWAFIMDRQGRMIWARKSPRANTSSPQTAWTIFVRPSRDRTNILLDEMEEVVWAGDWQDSRLLRMKLNGTVLHEYATPGMHHAYDELPDGRIAYLTHAREDMSGIMNQDRLAIVDDKGVDTTIWRCSDFADEYGLGNLSCPNNTLNYDPASDSYLLSFYSGSDVVWVDGDGTTLEHFNTATSPWDFVPADSQFSWQHGVHFTEAGTLLMSSQPSGGGWSTQLYVREYELDMDNKELVQIWSFTDENGADAQDGATAGEAHRLPDGNTLHNYGSGSRMREITPEKEVVWDAIWSGGGGGNGKLIGRTEFLDYEDLYNMLE